MQPIIALVAVTLIVHAVGMTRVEGLRPWPVALRCGLAVMFVMTGTAHFVGMRADLIRMVPPGLPRPDLLVSLTALLELAGAVGLLIRRTAPLAAACLSLLLVVLFPANVYAAQHGITTAPWDALVPRTLMQLAFLAATMTVAVSYYRRRPPADRPAAHDATPARVQDA
jgi:uncharacterized membrane protein